VSMVQTWQDALERAIRIAIDEGHLRADTDPLQLLFEVHGLILALHHDARFLRHPGAIERARAGFENVLSRYICVAPIHQLAQSPTAASRRKRSSASV
jgi:hypothetical protein